MLTSPLWRTWSYEIVRISYSHIGKCEFTKQKDLKRWGAQHVAALDREIYLWTMHTVMLVYYFCNACLKSNPNCWCKHEWNVCTEAVFHRLVQHPPLREIGTQYDIWMSFPRLLAMGSIIKWMTHLQVSGLHSKNY